MILPPATMIFSPIAIDVTAKAICEHLCCFQDAPIRTLSYRVLHTLPTAHPAAISQFPCNFFARVAPPKFVSTVPVVIRTPRSPQNRIEIVTGISCLLVINLLQSSANKRKKFERFRLLPHTNNNRFEREEFY